MLKEVIATGKDLETAKENARAALGAGPLDDVNYTILDMGSRGFLGFMARPTKIQATMEVADVSEARPRRERPVRENKPKNEAKPEAKETSGEKAPQEKKSGTKKKHGNKKHQGEKSNTSKQHSEVIPEPELKMERREVSTGEDMSFDFVKTVLTDIGLNAEAELYACEDGTRRINIVGEDASTLIGHHGDTLDALQYITNLVANKRENGEKPKYVKISIDIEGYRAKREEALRTLARRMADKVLRYKKSVMLEPMSPYERRIIHSEVQNIEGVATNSIGSDNNRKVVMYLDDGRGKKKNTQKSAESED